MATASQLPGSRRARRRFGVAGLLAGALVIGIIGTTAPTAAAEPEQAATVEELTDRVTAGRPGVSVRTFAPGDPVYVGELVRTGAGARATLRLADGTRVSLRPASVFRIEELGRTRHGDADASAPGPVMDLLRGGLRMVTGVFASGSPVRYRLHTPVAAVAIGAAEFDARLCPRGQCPLTHEEVGTGTAPVARVLQVHGVARAEGVNGALRVLGRGAALLRGDAIVTAADAWVVLHFVDGSRVALQPGTVFRIERWVFDPEHPGAGRAVLEVDRGGVRVLAGLIASAATDDYQLATPVAMIGVRGRGLDLQCLGACTGPGVGSARPLLRDGLLVSAWDGKVIARLEDRSVEFAAGQSGFLANAVAAPVRLPRVPGLLRQLPAPRPDGAGGALHPPPADRMYTSVHNGEIVVQGAQGPRLELGPGEAAVIPAGGAAQPLWAIPDALGERHRVPAAAIAGDFRNSGH